MKLTICTEKKTLIKEGEDGPSEYPLYSPEAFAFLSDQWLRVGWNQKYSYTFSWLGMPIIQLPEDMIRIQEVLFTVQPDVIIETGVAHGGSLVYYASLCKVFGRGRVIGVDIEIRSQNRKSIEEHSLFSYITLIEGSSTNEDVVAQVRSQVQEGDKILVILDSCHSKEHVREELEHYHGLVTPGSYIVATDGLMKDLHDVPRGQSDWSWDHPAAAAEEFAQEHPEFVLEQPIRVFNESALTKNVSHWPSAWLRRKE